MDNVIHIETNGKMTDTFAAMSLACLDKLNDLLETNKINYIAYLKYLRNVPGIKVIAYTNQDAAKRPHPLKRY